MKYLLIIISLTVSLNLQSADASNKSKVPLGQCSIFNKELFTGDILVGLIEINQDLTAQVYSYFGSVEDNSLEKSLKRRLTLTPLVTDLGLNSQASFALEAKEERTKCYPKSCGNKTEVTFFRIDLSQENNIEENYISKLEGFYNSFSFSKSIVKNCELSKNLKEVILN